MIFFRLKIGLKYDKLSYVKITQIVFKSLPNRINLGLFSIEREILWIRKKDRFMN